MNHKKYPESFDSLEEIRKNIPEKYLKSSWVKSYLSIATTTSLILFSWFFIYYLNKMDISFFIKIPVAILFSWYFYGTVITGGFDIAHDAAHQSLFGYEGKKQNTFWGTLFSSWVGWPFWLWKYAHDIHHRYTNNVKKDVAWEPYSIRKINRMPKFFKNSYKKIRSSPYFLWLGGGFHLLEQYIKFLKHTRFEKEDRPKIWTSIVFANVILLFTLVLSYLVAGWIGVISLFIVANVRYYYWLSVFTFLHHTHPDKKFIQDKDWLKKQGMAQMAGTIHVHYGKYTDFLTHDISWHVPHHVNAIIPHYYLREVSVLLKQKYPEAYHEEVFSWKYLTEVMNQCQRLMDDTKESDLTWYSFNEAEFLTERKPS